MKEPGLSEKEKLQAVKIQKYNAVRVGLEGKARLEAHKLRKHFYLMRTQDYLLQLGQIPVSRGI